MNRAFIQSLSIHLLFLILFFVIIKLDKKEIVETFKFSLIEKDIVVINKNPKVVVNSLPPASSTKAGQEKPREVFGVKRQAMTSDNGSVQAKIGNTLTKIEDDQVLKDSESDSLPEPAEEFLITSMPRPLKEVRPDYPFWAKEQKIEGSVIFDILIDKNGKVKEANLLRGLHPDLDNLAKEAILKFEFQPAFIEKEAAAVRIKYAIKFILES